MVLVEPRARRGLSVWYSITSILVAVGVVLRHVVVVPSYAPDISTSTHLDALNRVYNGIVASASASEPIKNHVPVSCDDLRVRAKQGEINDPNDGIDSLSATSRQTITNPPFWISLHNRNFDRLRWNAIMNKGEYYETGITEQFASILNDKTQGMVVDVGMNIGWFTLWARTLGHQVVSFEPNPANILRLCESIQLNKYEGLIRVYQYGVGDKQDNMTLTWGRNPGMATFHKDRLAKKTAKTHINVPVTTLDNFAAEAGWLNDPKMIHILKVDVEGHELYVFRGARRLIQSGRIQNILFEYSGKDKEELKELLTILLAGSYELRSISDSLGRVRNSELVAKLSAMSSLVSTDYLDRLNDMDAELEPFVKYSVNMWWVKRKGAAVA